jgi:exonuclease III
MNLKVMSWNCRGLARAPTIRALRAFIRNLRPDVLFLSETKVVASRFQASLLRLGFSSWLEVPPSGTRGGLFLTWKQGIVLDLFQMDQNHISCLVSSDTSASSWMISCIYAPHTSMLRSAFWSNLTALGASFGGPWLLLGDFNSILSPLRKVGVVILGLLLTMNLWILYTLMLWLIWGLWATSSPGVIIGMVGITSGRGWIVV